MRHYSSIAAVLFAAYAVSGAGLADPADYRDLVFSLAASQGGRDLATGNGVAVGRDGWILTSQALVHGADRITVTGAQQGVMSATVVAEDRSLDLALIRVQANLDAVTFAKSNAADGDVVSSIGYWGNNTHSVSGSKGSVGGVLPGYAPLATHNALYASGGLGSLLINECGEAVGINRIDPTAQGAAGVPSTHAVAASLAQIRSFLSRSGIRVATAQAACQPAAVTAQQEADAARARADEAEAKARRLQNSVTASEREKKAALLAAKQLRQAADNADLRRTEAEKNAEKANQQAVERRRAAAAAAAAEQRTRKRALWGGIIGGILLVAIAGIATLLTLRARRHRNLAELEREEAVRAVTPPEGAHDLLLEGAAPGGEIFAIKIPALALSEERGGAVIGRNPDSASFVINRKKVSRQHCRLFVADRQLFVEDLGSTNGTILNGVAVVGRAELQADDEFYVGDVLLRVNVRDQSTVGSADWV